MTAIPLVRLDGPAVLVTSIPALLGFHPQHSAVVILLRGGWVVLTVRVDLPGPEECLSAYVEHLLDAALPATDADRAALVIIASRPWRDLADALGAELGHRSIDLRVSLWVPSTRPGAPWRCHDGCCEGSVGDAAMGPLAVAEAVTSGRRILPSRDAIAADLAPTVDTETMARRAEQIANSLLRPGVCSGMAAVMAALEELGTGRLALDEQRVVHLALALHEVGVRDRVLRALTGHSRPLFHTLWLTLVREVPTPHVVVVASLLATTAMLNGEGALADAALTRAEAADPDHKLTWLLRHVHRLGIDPAELGSLLAGL